MQDTISIIINLPKQVALYIPNIDRSPTNDDVVVETLCVTQRCAQAGV